MVHVGGKKEIEIVAGRFDAGMAGRQGPVARGRAPPRLDDHTGRGAAVQHFVPADQSLAVAGRQGRHPCVEVRLQGNRVAQFMALHERSDCIAFQPPAWEHLVTAYMYIGVGKYFGKFAEQVVDYLVDRFVRHVEYRRMGPESLARGTRKGSLGMGGRLLLPIDVPIRHPTPSAGVAPSRDRPPANS